MIISAFLPEERAEIVRRYEARENLKLIAWDYRTTTGAISKIAHAAGCAKRANRSPRTHELMVATHA